MEGKKLCSVMNASRELLPAAIGTQELFNGSGQSLRSSNEAFVKRRDSYRLGIKYLLVEESFAHGAGGARDGRHGLRCWLGCLVGHGGSIVRSIGLCGAF